MLKTIEVGYWRKLLTATPTKFYFSSDISEQQALHLLLGIGAILDEPALTAGIEADQLCEDIREASLPDSNNIRRMEYLPTGPGSIPERIIAFGNRYLFGSELATSLFSNLLAFKAVSLFSGEAEIVCRNFAYPPKPMSTLSPGEQKKVRKEIKQYGWKLTNVNRLMDKAELWVKARLVKESQKLAFHEYLKNTKPEQYTYDSVQMETADIEDLHNFSDYKELVKDLRPFDKSFGVPRTKKR